MAYGEKYILSFISERGNDYKISILQQGYSGSAVSKKLGVAPSLSIEEGDGRIKGSSLSFSIQADVEGELSGLYTTNNKEFKVILYRNNSVYWQGYLLPELYSENYVDPPFDVAVTATDQLATLKDIPYQAQEQQMSLLSIIKNILNYTEITLPCTVHMQIEDSQGLSLLENHHISAAAMNGYSCYDALSALLLSCNACIMQIGNEWLITSLTDNTSAYYKEGQLTNRPHPAIGQMLKADIYPDGSLTMVNAPAIKGAALEYNHILRNSMLKNAECRSREYWNYLPGEVDARFPSEFQAIDGVVYKCFSWSLQEKNIAKDSSLQLWQDVQLNTDESFNYQLSVKYLSDIRSKLLLLSIAHYGDDGIVRRLTAEGWKKSVDKNDINSYIQITSSQTDYTARYVWDIADTSKYEVANVQFALPEVSGSLRVGFINSTTDYAEPVMLGGMFVTDIFLTPLNIAGKRATTVVEQLATTSQQEVVISYGDKTQSNNDSLISFNTLRSAQGGYVNAWNLSGREYSSYFLMMLQEFSRYFGSKRMQLQGAIMGKDILHPFYVDSFSGKILRLLSAQYDLLQDTMNTNIEEVPVAFVEYDTTVYAKENVHNNQSTSGSVVAAGGGESLLSEQSDGNVYVKNDRPLTGFEARFEQLALPKDVPAKPKEGEVYIYNKEASAEEEWNDNHINIQAIIAKVKRLESMWFVDKNNEDTIRTTWNIIVEKAVTFGQGKKEVADNGGSGGNSGNGAGITAFSIIVNGAEYKLQNGVITLPNYPIVPKSLPNPYALKINNVVYDGSAPQEITIEAKDVDLTGYATEDWVSQQGFLKQIDREDVVNALEYVPQEEVTEGNKLPYSLISGTPTSLKNPYSLTIKAGDSTVQYDGSTTKSITITAASLGALTEHQDISHLLSKEQAKDTYQPIGNYVTLSELNNRNYITAGSVSDTYATQAQLNNTNNNLLDLQDAHDTLRSEFDALDDLLNSDVSGKINTWQEVVNFLDEYSGSQDLAAILSGINADIAKRALQTNLDSAVARISTLETKVSTLDDIFGVDASGNVYVKKKTNGTARDFYTYGAISFGGVGESNSGGNGGITSVTYDMVVGALGYTPYNSTNPNNYVSSSVLGSFAYKNSITASDIPSLNWSKITSGKPTTLSGYGITDAYTKIAVDSAFLGINTLGIDANGVTNLNKVGYGYAAGGWYGSGPALAFGSTNGYTALIQQGADTHTLYVSCKSNGGDIQDWKTIAFTDSNVASATKLKNARTLWGQSFNGTKNISGSLSDVTTITATGNISTDGNLVTSSDVYGNYFLIKNRSSNPYYKLTDGSYSGYVQLLTDGSMALGSTSAYSLTIDTDGNTRVNGNLVITGAITFGTASDRRLKDNVKSLSYEQAISVVMGLNPVTFKWNTTATELGKLSGISDGFIADEYEELIPNSGRAIWANYRAIDYTRAIPYVTAVVQNHETRLGHITTVAQNNETRLEAAERRINELENELKQYRRA